MKSRLIHIFLIILLYGGCATLTTPNGGPKDVKPPVLLSSIPKNKQTDFKAKTLELTFDEYVKLNNPKEEIIISPSPGKEVEYKVSKTRVLITPKDGWQPETTYSVQFREGIRDFTEGNIPTNLKLAFSTGSTIDSLAITGNVYNILKGDVAEKITVAIYQSDTFDIFVDTPAYFSKTDKNGNFSLENIKAGTYTLYAFDDKNKNLKAESRAERYGFIGQPLQLFKKIDSLKIGLIMMDARPLKLATIRSVGMNSRVRFNKFITDYTLHDDTTTINTFGDNQTEVNLRNPFKIGDSLKIHISATDSLLNKTDSTFYIKRLPVEPMKESFKWSLGSPTIQAESGKFTTTITHSKAISEINIDSLYIDRDTVEIITFNKQDFKPDLQHKSITITKTLSKEYFKDDKDPIFKLKTGTGFLISIDNDTTKRLTSGIPTLYPEGTGTVLVQTRTTQPDYIVQLLDGDKIVASEKNITSHVFKNLEPAQYSIRVILDTNKNGRWDPGNYYKKIEPEKIVYYTTPEGGKTFPIRANWELGPLIVRF